MPLVRFAQNLGKDEEVVVAAAMVAVMVAVVDLHHEMLDVPVRRDVTSVESEVISRENAHVIAEEEEEGAADRAVPEGPIQSQDHVHQRERRVTAKVQAGRVQGIELRASDEQLK